MITVDIEITEEVAAEVWIGIIVTGIVEVEETEIIAVEVGVTVILLITIEVGVEVVTKMKEAIVAE